MFHMLSTVQLQAMPLSLVVCPEMDVNEIHLPYNRHHKVSSLTKFHHNTQNYIKYEVYENV